VLVNTARCFLTRSNVGYFVFFPLGVFPILVSLFFPFLPNFKPLWHWGSDWSFNFILQMAQFRTQPCHLYEYAQTAPVQTVRQVYSKAVNSSIYRTHYITPYNYDILLSLCFQPINFTRCEASCYVITLQTQWRFPPFSSLVSVSTMLITLTIPTLSCYCPCIL
jgi:hypothetical protein